jgi:1,4-alpha-glucan branching enzyme
MLKRSAPTGTITFCLPIDDLDQAVSVVGDFNDWDPFAHPMKKRSNGTRSVKIALEPGQSYRFKYLTEDGSWLTEPDADTVDNGMWGVDSLVTP